MPGDVGGERLYAIGRPAGFSAARAIARSARIAAGVPLGRLEGTGEFDERKARGEEGDLGRPDKTLPACAGAEQESKDSDGGEPAIGELCGSRVLDICLLPCGLYINK